MASKGDAVVNKIGRIKFFRAVFLDNGQPGELVMGLKRGADFPVTSLTSFAGFAWRP